jgi:hypothetical protein
MLGRLMIFGLVGWRLSRGTPDRVLWVLAGFLAGYRRSVSFINISESIANNDQTLPAVALNVRNQITAERDRKLRNETNPNPRNNPS